MKKNRTLLYSLFGALAIGLVSSCNDDFSEEDLLRLQQELADERNEERAAQALAALDQAGEFYEFTITVNNDDSFVEGASVTLYGQEAGDITQTTDANGSTTFTSVTSGGNIVTISATGFADAVLNIDLPELEEGVNYEITSDGLYIPLRASTSAIVPLFATDGSAGSVAEIRGRVEIETDVTNLTTEIPQNIQITAVLDLNEVRQSSFGVFVSRYAFDSSNDIGFGVADVDNVTGEYSMLVPATAQGVAMSLQVPNIEAPQRIAVGYENNIQLPRPEYRDIMTNFGPAFGTNSIPTVNGVVAVFPEPPAPGTGFTLSNFQRVPAPLTSFNLHRINDNFTLPEDEGSVIFQFTSLGEGYSSSPTVTISDNTGSNARAEAYVEFAVGGVTVGTAGTGYGSGETIAMDVIAERLLEDGSTIDYIFATLSVTADADGDIGQSEVSASVDNAITNNLFGFDPSNLVHVRSGGVSYTSSFNTPDEMAGVRVEFTGGLPTAAVTGTPTLSVGRLFSVVLTDQGEDYTLPSFSFSGGGATSQAALNVLAYESQWTFDPDNSNASGYTALPDLVYYEYMSANVEPSNDATVIVQPVLNGVAQSSVNLIDALSVNGSGGLMFTDQVATYRTSAFSATEPVAQVTDRTTEIAYARVNLDNGSLNFISNIGQGQGYVEEFDVSFEPSIPGAPGSGMAIDLFFGSFNGDEYEWGGSYQVLSRGSGYLSDLNQKNQVGGSDSFQFTTGSSFVTVRTGDVIVVNIDYGTGQRQVDVDGSWFYYDPN